MPEVVDTPSHHVKLAVLILRKTLAQHPLFEFAIESESLSVVLGEKLRDLPVLFHEHHWITCEFKPAGEGILGNTLILVH